MTQQIINIGTSPNDGTGDTLLEAFDKVNQNFTDLYTNSYATNVVNSFNTRVGVVTLNSSDITAALGYRPFNPAGDTATGVSLFNQGFTSLSTVDISTNNISVIPLLPASSVLGVLNVDGTSSDVLLDTFASGTPNSNVILRGARGTGASASAVQTSDIIASVSANGYGATTFQTSPTASIQFIAENTFNDANQPTAISFKNTSTASITQSERMHLSSGGILSVSTNLPASSQTTGSVVVTGGTGITGSVYAGTSIVTGALNGAMTSSSVAFTGGISIDGTAIGSTTAAAASFTNLVAQSFTKPALLGVGNGGLGIAIPQYNLIIAAGSSTTVALAPSATAGQSVNSAGTSANPIYGFAKGALINVRVFTSSATYTPTTGTNSVIIECVGGGGGGGGTTTTVAAQYSASAGGCTGAYARVRFTTGFSGAVMTIGAAGTAGAASTAVAGTGGTTSFGALISCPGGIGGGGGSALSTTVYGFNAIMGARTAAPTISGGTTLLSILGLGDSISFNATPSGAGAGTPITGLGSSSMFWGMGGSPTQLTPNVGSSGTGFGSTSTGVCIGASTTGTVGLAGQPGVIIVYEYA